MQRGDLTATTGLVLDADVVARAQERPGAVGDYPRQSIDAAAGAEAQQDARLGGHSGGGAGSLSEARERKKTGGGDASNAQEEHAATCVRRFQRR
ncbi:hypothetical protein D3C86_1686670 [compost metagenome]